TLPTGQNLGVYFDQVGLVQPQSGNVVFVDINEALEWAEERILNQRSGREREGEKLLEVDDILLFSSMPRQMMGCLAPHIRNISFRANDKIFHHGDQGDDIFIIRRGVVKIMLPLDGGSSHHLASFGRGDFFGDVAFLDRQKRSADAIAETDTDIFAISREDFEKACQEEPMIGSHVFLSLAHILAARLRRADAEIQDLKMS
ncbi:MAG: cyclic nucleotide-binding domain-containing protein, partial [Nitrospinota bacterium]|nr:cyclic nucleotide-binding domain-containing protein [Nitrospinota bacterium]